MNVGEGVAQIYDNGTMIRDGTLRVGIMPSQQI